MAEAQRKPVDELALRRVMKGIADLHDDDRRVLTMSLTASVLRVAAGEGALAQIVGAMLGAAGVAVVAVTGDRVIVDGAMAESPDPGDPDLPKIEKILDTVMGAAGDALKAAGL